MRRHIGILMGSLALVALAGVGWNAPAFAADQTVLTKFTGSPSISGTWTRTITDISEPNDPGKMAFPSTYKIRVVYLNTMSASQLAAAYKAACIAALPPPANNPHGYGAVNENSMSPTVRVSKQSGTFSFSDSAIATGSQIVDSFAPFNAEHAPAASPAGLATLVAGLSALAWWARRRRVTA